MKKSVYNSNILKFALVELEWNLFQTYTLNQWHYDDRKWFLKKKKKTAGSLHKLKKNTKRTKETHNIEEKERAKDDLGIQPLHLKCQIYPN